MVKILMAVGFCLLGYLLGSIPSALWITRLIKGIDVRDGGSGHVSTTNTIRQAGWLPAVVVLILDVGKGFLPTWVAFNYSPFEWAVPVTAAFAVAGHCWPLYAQFRGGMGLATTGGAIIAVYPLGFAIGLGIVIFLTLAIKHSARAGFFTGILMAPVFYLFGERGIVIWLAAAAGIVLIIRFRVDWNREYRELWLDREQQD
jgi:glycerol-3-phosphate acyltransferase PlsY